MDCFAARAMTVGLPGGLPTNAKKLRRFASEHDGILVTFHRVLWRIPV
jgi:hypothetical protein